MEDKRITEESEKKRKELMASFEEMVSGIKEKIKEQVEEVRYRQHEKERG